MNFEEISVVKHRLDHLAHVVRLTRRFRDQGVQRLCAPINRVLEALARWIFGVVLRQEAQEATHTHQSLGIVGAGEVGNSADLSVHACAPQIFRSNLFMRDRLDDIRPRDVHIAGAIDHEDEVGQRGRIDRPTGAWPQDRGQLRHDTARLHVAQKQARVAGQGHHAFLNTRPA